VNVSSTLRMEAVDLYLVNQSKDSAVLVPLREYRVSQNNFFVNNFERDSKIRRLMCTDNVKVGQTREKNSRERLSATIDRRCLTRNRI